MRQERTGSLFNYIICFTFVGIMILGTFVLPQIYGYQVDDRSLDRVIFQQRDPVVLSTNLSLTVKDRAAIVTNLASEGGISLFMNLEGSQLFNDELLENVNQELRWAIQCGVLPSVMNTINLNDQTGSLSADYYMLGSAASDYGEMALWRIQYSSESNYEITLLVDAENYKIYYGELGGSVLADPWLENQRSGGEGAYMSAWMQYYEAEYAEPIWLEYIFEIEDAGVFGWMEEKNNLWKADGHVISFGFNVFWEYFKGESILSVYGLE